MRLVWIKYFFTLLVIITVGQDLLAKSKRRGKRQGIESLIMHIDVGKFYENDFECYLPEKPMVVIVPSYNNVYWHEKNLESIFGQKYENFRVIYIDDCSEDGTADRVEDWVIKHGFEHRCILVRNKERKGALANLYWAINQCDNQVIVVTVDGDDRLHHNKVFKKLNFIYSTKNVWLTHGSMVETESKSRHWCIAVPQDIVKNNSYRAFRCPSHLRTFYAWLFKKIHLEDLLYEGKFFTMTWDQAMMFPMIEMAGERHAYIDEVLYVYNTTTNLNDNKVNAQLQRDLEQIIRSKPVYRRLDESLIN